MIGRLDWQVRELAEVGSEPLELRLFSNPREHLLANGAQPVDVYLVIRQTDERSSEGTISWMNVTRYLKRRKDKTSRQIVFDGERLDMQAVWKLRDRFCPPPRGTTR